MRYRYAGIFVLAGLAAFCALALLGAIGAVGDSAPPPEIEMKSVYTPYTPPADTTTPETEPERASRGAARTAGIPLLERIAACESGGEPDPYVAQNRHSTASGKYQVLDTTWDGYFDYRHAKDAPPWVQEQFAEALFRANGATPWNASRSCWG